MPVHQQIVKVETRGRGFHELTDAVARALQASGLRHGHAVAFCRHTSCSLVLMENADPTARADLERFLARLAPDGDPAYTHDAEGPDDMSAHLRMVLTRSSETIPFADGRLLLGTWQGLFLWEHRTAAHRRSVVLSLCGE